MVPKAKGAEGMKQTLQIYENLIDFPNIDEIIGTHRSDPHGGSAHVLYYLIQFACPVTCDIEQRTFIFIDCTWGP
jgi:hypothetical protein